MRRSINALALALALGLGLGLGLLGLGAGASAQTPSPQCVASALAGGTVNAITIPALPCTGTSALVLVTAAGANTGAVTLQQIGQPALAVTKLGGAALAAGDIPVAGAVMLLQATGQQWVLLNPGTTGGVGVVPTVAALRGLTAGAASAAVTQGYNSAGDGGGATYQWASGSSCTDDSVTCIRPNSAPVTGRWLGVFPSGAVNLYQAGLVPSSSTVGDASGLMNAIWTAGLSVYVPPGEWHIKNQLLCKAGLELEGAGQFASIITIGAATNDFNLSASSVLQAGTYGGNGCQIDGVKLQFYQPSFGGMTIANIVHYPVAIDGGNSTASGNWIYGGSIGTGSPVQITNAWTCVSLNNTQALGEGAWHLGNVNCSDYAGGLTLGGVISTIWVANWDEETFGMTSDQALVYESQGESGAALAVQIGRCDGCSFGTFATFAHGFKQLDSGATRGPATDITGVNVGVLELDGDGATLINGGGYVRVGALYGTNSSADTAGKIKSNPGAGLYAYTTVGTLGVIDGAPSGDVSTSGAGVTVLTLGSGWYESLTVNSGASPWNFAGSNVTVVIGGINYIDPGGETVPQIVANCTCTVKFAGTNFTVPNSNRSAAVVSQAGAGTNLVMQGVSFTPGTSTGNVIAVGSDNVGNFLGSISAHGWGTSLAGTNNGIYWLNESVNKLNVNQGVTGNVQGHVATLAALQGSCFSATGCTLGAGGGIFSDANRVVIRDDYSVGLGAPPLAFKGETGTCASNGRANDGGSCVNTTSGDGNSFYAVFASSGVDIREWGADGTTANDATALTAIFALTTGNLISVPNGTWNLPCGTYYAAASGIGFLGASETGAILKLAATCNLGANILFSWDGVSGGKMQNLTIDLNTPAASSFLPAIVSFRAYAADVTGAVIDHVRIINGISPVFLINAGASGHTLNGLLITNNTLSMTAATTQNQCIGLTTVNNAGKIPGAHVANNTCAGSGIQIDGTGSIVSGNDVSGFAFGAGIVGVDSTSNPASCSNAQFINNVIHDTTSGVDINNTAHLGLEIHCPYSQILGNTEYKLGGSGITSSGDYTTIANNLAYDNGKNGSGGAGGTGDQAGIFIEVVPADTFSTGTGVVVGPGNNSFDDGAGTQLYGLTLSNSITAAHPIRLMAGSTYTGTTQGILNNAAEGGVNSDWLYTAVIASTIAPTASFTFSSLDTASYKHWHLHCDQITPAAAKVMYLRVGEANVIKTGSFYGTNAGGIENGSAIVPIHTGTGIGIQLSNSAVDATQANPGIIDMQIGDLNYGGVGHKSIMFDSTYLITGGGGIGRLWGQGDWENDAAAINELQIIADPSGSTSTTGICRLDGRP